MLKALKTLALLAWTACGLLLLLTILQHRGVVAPDFLAGMLGRASGARADASHRAPPPWPVVDAEVASAAAPRPTGHPFLGFRLPEDAFCSERWQRFEIIPEQSRVGFDAATPIDTFSAISSQIRGFGEARPVDPQAGARAQLVVDASSLSTGDAGRDEKLHEGLQVDVHPEIRFSLDSFETGELDLGSMSLTGRARCTMLACGSEQRLELPVAMHIDGQGRLTLQAEVVLSLSEMGVEVDSALGVPLLSDEITMWFGIRGRLAERVDSIPSTATRELADAR